MVRTTVETLDEADLLYMLMDATSLPGPGDLAAIKYMKEALAKRPRPVILVVTKVDLVNKQSFFRCSRLCQIVRLDGGSPGLGTG